MCHVAERYDGTMAVRVVGDVFHLNVMLPVSDPQAPRVQAPRAQASRTE